MGSDRLLTAAEVAELLSVPVSWVREHTRSGRIPHVQLGHYVRYRHETLVKLGRPTRSGSVPTTPPADPNMTPST